MNAKTVVFFCIFTILLLYLLVYIRTLNLIISELKSITKGKNMDGHKNMSKKQSEELFIKPQRSKRQNREQNN